ncbi:hypothetical protein ACFWP2_11460 [Kitasatospora sp. NPDC058444]|uniref:DUF4190 domain-containing protein n=1 Tax=Kitasatospora sp. NPDC058444 TaxID=3346504 RepID=UPI003655724B
MTVPVPPDSSPPPAEEPAGADPWAPPLIPGQGETPRGGEATAPAPATAPPVTAPAPAGAPGVPYWPPYPMPMPAPQPRNGLGIAALVLGILGVVLGLAVILFWLSWLPALLAVVFGAIGLGYARRGVATNRAMALAGVILGVTGLLVSVGAGVFVVSRVQTVKEERRAEADAERARSEAATKAAQERAAKEKARIEAERKRIEAEKEKEAADERARRLSFGQSYTYPDGLKVTMAAPEPYVPRGSVGEIPKDARIVQVRITVVNTGSAEVSLYGSGLPTVRDAKGGLVFTLIDGSGRMKILTRSLAPGEEADGLTAYALPADAADPFSVRFDHGAGSEHKNVIWTGPPS